MAKNSDGPSAYKDDKKAEAWFAQHDDNEQYNAFTSKEEMDRIGLEIFSRVTQQKNGAKIRRLNFIKYAAAVLLVTGTTFLALYTLPEKQPQSRKAQWSLYENSGSGNRIVRLSDSSVVTLRSGAKIQVAANYGQQTRRVRLENGEAFFDVQKDPKHPFIVNSGTAEVKVLGTAFNVIHHAGSSDIDVTVSHGKVKVSDDGRQLAVLTKGRHIRYSRETNKLILDRVSLSAVSAWTKSSMELSNVSFTELSEVFTSFYGNELLAADADIRKFQYTITITKESSALSTAKIIAKIHGLNLTQSHGKITLHH